MIDWKVNARALHCYYSDKPFVKGDRVTTFLFRDEEGLIQRIDLLEGEQKDPNFTLPSTILGRWTREMPDSNDPKKIQKQVLANAEECFVSLFSQKPEPEIDILKQLLSLRLEQKRILRAVDFNENDQIQTYFHPKNQTEYLVSMKSIDPTLLLRIENQIEILLSS